MCSHSLFEIDLNVYHFSRFSVPNLYIFSRLPPPFLFLVPCFFYYLLLNCSLLMITYIFMAVVSPIHLITFRWYSVVIWFQFARINCTYHPTIAGIIFTFLSKKHKCTRMKEKKQIKLLE